MGYIQAVDRLYEGKIGTHHPVSSWRHMFYAIGVGWAVGCPVVRRWWR